MQRLASFFALDDAWTRPTPPIGRADLLIGAGFELLTLLTVELTRSAGGLDHVDQSWWMVYLMAAAAAGLLVLRRRYPVAVAVLMSGHMFLTGVTMPQLVALLPMQICYFGGVYAAMAWGPSRRTSLLVTGGIFGFMMTWVAWQFAIGNAIQQWLGDDLDRGGFLSPIPAAITLTMIINGLYFLGAIVAGQVAWRAARQRARLSEQAVTIAEQAETLRRRAVVDERLRIARELHDVVGHHVSVIGVQAAGARRVLTHDTAAAEQALGNIEDSSREAVDQMRSLLGTLRDLEHEMPAEHRRSEPGLAELGELVDSRDGDGLRTSYAQVVDDGADPTRIPQTVGLSLYRTAQEALANVTRHSTATRASVTLRLTDTFAELEVLDDGRPRGATSGSGLGLLGIRERVASHRGECEIGPRSAAPGYRVRVRLPLRPAHKLRRADTGSLEAAGRG